MSYGVQCKVSPRQVTQTQDNVGLHHENILVDAAGDCTSDVSKTGVQISCDGNIEGPSRQISQDPFEGSIQTSGASSGDHAASTMTSETKGIKNRKKSEKKAEPSKRRTKKHHPSEVFLHHATTEASCSVQPGASLPTSTVCSQKRAESILNVISKTKGTKKRKRSEKKKEPSKRNRKKLSPTDSLLHQVPNEASNSVQPGASLKISTACGQKRADFDAKYLKGKQLRRGVFAGYRKCDHLPVALKHIPKGEVEHVPLFVNGKWSLVPLEVVMMGKVQIAAKGPTAVVALLEFYDMCDELILILERPVPCLDMIDFLNARQFKLQEHEAKTIIKQVVDAVIKIQSSGVFHRDIKPDNILVEIVSDVPRIKIIDFGSSTFMTEEDYTTLPGTPLYSPPEWFRDSCYRAEPTTVWQVGHLMFVLLHKHFPFNTSDEIIHKNLSISVSLSSDGRDFLLSCLNKCSEARPTVERLKNHPWLI